MDLKILKLQLMNKLLTILLFSFFLLNNNLSANPNIVAKTAILVDFDSDEILYELEPDMQIYPASMTKIMTSIIVFDLLKNNKISLDDKFIVSEKAWRLSQSGYSSMFIMVNDEVSVEDLLKGIIIASGNDACVAIAEGIAGTEENFADMMNEKAGEIGMLNSNFTNSSGINDPDNYSTVRDIAIMSKHLIKNYPDLYKMYAEKEFTWDKTGGDPITQGNRNPLLYKNIGADGIKTGFLSIEKYSLAASIFKNNRRLINAKIKENIQIRAKSDSNCAAVCIRCGGITTRAQQLFSPKHTICSTCLFILITVVYSLSSWRSSRDRCIVRSARSKTSLGACRRTGGSFDSIFRGRSSHPKRV